MPTRLSFKVISSVSAITRPANTTAYAAGDVISDTTGDAHHTFDNVLRTKPTAQDPFLSGTIERALLSSSQNNTTLKLDGELWLFHTDVATAVDNAAIAFTDAEMLTNIGIIPFPVGDWQVGLATTGVGGNANCFAENLNMVVKGNVSNNIFGQLVARNAYAPVTGEIFTVTLFMQQD